MAVRQNPHEATYIEAGDTPLLRLCRNDLRGDDPVDPIVKLMLLVGPHAARIPDPAGRLPLHWALAKNHLQYVTVMQLVAAYPPALTVADPETGHWPFAMARDLSLAYTLLRMDPSVLEHVAR